MEMHFQSHKTNPSFKVKMTQLFLKERDGGNKGRRTICTQSDCKTTVFVAASSPTQPTAPLRQSLGKEKRFP